MKLPHSDKIAVIGAGFSGLGAAAALKRHGIPFDVFEADRDLGGNWLHGVYHNVHIISSRRTTQYAEFPMPDSYPDFPGAVQIRSYLHSFTEHFGLRPHIRFQTTVEEVEPQEDGTWVLRLSTGETAHYRGVIVCNGPQRDPVYPSIPGRFSGQVLHARQYRDPAMLKDKRVLVIGGGNSGCDIAVEAARSGAASHISLRRGYWFLPRTVMGTPLPDLSSPWTPLWLQRLILRAVLLITVGDYRKYGLQRPDHKLFEHHPVINTDLLHHLKLGRIIPHPDVKSFDGEQVAFADGTREVFDLVVHATGYRLSFPFLPEGLLDMRNGVPQLLAGLVHPHARNLYFLEFHHVRYGVGPLISAEAEAVCALIRVQDQLRYPVGTVLRKLGYRPPSTLMTGPFEVIRSARRLSRLAPFLPRLERILRMRADKHGRVYADNDALQTFASS